MLVEGVGGSKLIDGEESLVLGEDEGQLIPTGLGNLGIKEERGGNTDPGRIGKLPSKKGDGGAVVLDLGGDETRELGFSGSTGPDRIGRPVGEEE